MVAQGARFRIQPLGSKTGAPALFTDCGLSLAIEVTGGKIFGSGLWPRKHGGTYRALALCKVAAEEGRRRVPESGGPTVPVCLGLRMQKFQC